MIQLNLNDVNEIYFIILLYPYCECVCVTIYRLGPWTSYKL